MWQALEDLPPGEHSCRERAVRQLHRHRLAIAASTPAPLTPGTCKQCAFLATGIGYHGRHETWCAKASLNRQKLPSDTYLEENGIDGIVWDPEWDKPHESFYKALVAGTRPPDMVSAPAIKFLIDTKMWNDCLTAYDDEYELQDKVPWVHNIKGEITILKRKNVPPLNGRNKQHKHKDGITRRSNSKGPGYPAPCVTFYKWIKMPDQNYKKFPFYCNFHYYFLHKFREVHTKEKKKRTAWEQKWYTAIVKKGDAFSTGLHVSHRDSNPENHDLEYLIIEPDKDNAARWMYCFGYGECTDCTMKFKNPQCKCNPICTGKNVFCCEDCVNKSEAIKSWGLYQNIFC